MDKFMDKLADRVSKIRKLSASISYQWDNSLIFFFFNIEGKNIEGELISEIDNEFQILGPR